MAYDGADAIHVARSLPLLAPQAGLLTPVDVPAVPECVLGGNNPCATAPIRQCVCPPGGLAVDAGSGLVYVSYTRQNGGSNGGGVGIARSDDQGLTWSYSSVPGTGSSGSAFDTQWNFAPIRVDSAGNVYVAWGESQGVQTDANGQSFASKGVAIRYSWSSDHGSTWHAPVTVSTTTATNVLPSLDVVSPGVVDIAWYGSNSTGDPNLVPATATWNLMFAQVTDALGNPSFAPLTAVAGVHTGCIQSGGVKQCADRSLLDFFQLVVDHAGMANIVFPVGNADANGLSQTTLQFTRQVTGAAGPVATAKVNTGSGHSAVAPGGAADAAGWDAAGTTARVEYRSIRCF
jgi:hypothetical protein